MVSSTLFQGNTQHFGSTFLHISVKFSTFSLKITVIDFFPKWIKLATDRLQRTHQLQSSNPKERIFRKGLKILLLGYLLHTKFKKYIFRKCFLVENCA